MVSYDFTGKNIVVTGAGAGIGRAIVDKLVGYGANIIAVSLYQFELDTLVQQYPEVKAIQADVTDWEGVKAKLEGIGPIHGLVNNAGVIGGTNLGQIKATECDRIFDVNVKAVINLSQIVMANMLENKVVGGSIVNISSIAASYSIKGGALYCASKAALQSLTSTMSLELGNQGIRVNSVNPSWVKTEMTAMILRNESMYQNSCNLSPLGRWPEASDVADAVAFLLSDQASNVNGIALPVDGGLRHGLLKLF